MKYLCIGEEYTNNAGEKKMAWKRIGELFTGKNGKEYAKIYTIPGTLIHVYEAEKKEQAQAEPEFV